MWDTASVVIVLALVGVACFLAGIGLGAVQTGAGRFYRPKHRPQVGAGRFDWRGQDFAGPKRHVEHQMQQSRIGHEAVQHVAEELQICPACGGCRGEHCPGCRRAREGA